MDAIPNKFKENEVHLYIAIIKIIFVLSVVCIVYNINFLLCAGIHIIEVVERRIILFVLLPQINQWSDTSNSIEVTAMFSPIH